MSDDLEVYDDVVSVEEAVAAQETPQEPASQDETAPEVVSLRLSDTAVSEDVSASDEPIKVSVAGVDVEFDAPDDVVEVSADEAAVLVGSSVVEVAD